MSSEGKPQILSRFDSTTKVLHRECTWIRRIPIPSRKCFTVDYSYSLRSGHPIFLRKEGTAHGSYAHAFGRHYGRAGVTSTARFALCAMMEPLITPKPFVVVVLWFIETEIVYRKSEPSNSDITVSQLSYKLVIFRPRTGEEWGYIYLGCVSGQRFRGELTSSDRWFRDFGWLSRVGAPRCIYVYY